MNNAAFALSQTGEIRYPTDTTSEEWAIIEQVFASTRTTGRPRAHADKAVYDAIQYVLRGGIAWALLPQTYPPYQTVYRWFRFWTLNGTFERLNDAVRSRLRVELGRKPTPTAGSIDSQSIKTGPGARDTGYDGGKHVKGRRRHIVVDTEGFILTASITPANFSEQKEAALLLDELALRYPTIAKLWVDGGYAGEPLRAAAAARNIILEVVHKLATPGFTALPRRWVIERSFAWLTRYRRLARDYEVTATSAAGFVYLASASTMLRRLVRHGAPARWAGICQAA